MDIADKIGDRSFGLRIDRRLYAREAVMKALYRWTDQYAISFYYEGDYFIAECESKCTGRDSQVDRKEMISCLHFEMIRYDTAKRTRGLRELLVGRALYATCIELDQGDSDEDVAGQQDLPADSWEDDAFMILQSWAQDEMEES